MHATAEILLVGRNQKKTHTRTHGFTFFVGLFFFKTSFSSPAFLDSSFDSFDSVSLFFCGGWKMVVFFIFPLIRLYFLLFFLSFSLSPAAAMHAGERNGSVTEK
jgi:hypothetical protein